MCKGPRIARESKNSGLQTSSSNVPLGRKPKVEGVSSYVFKFMVARPVSATAANARPQPSRHGFSKAFKAHVKIFRAQMSSGKDSLSIRSINEEAEFLQHAQKLPYFRYPLVSLSWRKAVYHHLLFPYPSE